MICSTYSIGYPLFAQHARTRRNGCCICGAATKDESSSQETKQRTKLPERGFFAEADTNATVYSPLNTVSSGSIYKREGRYNPEFLWNTNWKAQLDLEDAVDRAREEAAGRPEDAKGGLGLSALTQLDSMEVDLTERLLRRAPQTTSIDTVASSEATPWKGRQAIMQQQADAKRKGYPQMPPRRGEAQRWERSSKFAKRAAPQEPSTPEETAAQLAAVEAERVAYAGYKAQLLQATLLLSASLVGLTYACYDQNVAASYAVGAVGSVVYLNMLNRSIDGLGGMGAAAAQPRLLIPLVLAMGYNRWNTLAAGTTGVELTLMPMLLGFLTYKGAVIAKGAVDLFSDLSGDDSTSASDGSRASTNQVAGRGASEDSAQPSAERARTQRDYASRVLQG